MAMTPGDGAPCEGPTVYSGAGGPLWRTFIRRGHPGESPLSSWSPLTNEHALITVMAELSLKGKKRRNPTTTTDPCGLLFSPFLHDL